MKMRIEPWGIHYYNRINGIHVLLDEIIPPPSSYSLAPRTVSMAITNECDFSCSYCYVDLQDKYLSKETIISNCKQLDKLGTFDIAFGGGEPTLHPDLPEICQTIWTETELGISITTHGHHLNDKLIHELRNNISFIRVSIDGVEPIYSILRGRPLSSLLTNLNYLKGQIPFGINTVVNKLTISNLDSLKELFLSYGAAELLLLPMWVRGKYSLSTNEWQKLEEWIDKNRDVIPIRISSDAKSYLGLPYLFDIPEWDNEYAFIGVDNTFRKNSFSKEGVLINKYSSIEQLLLEWRASTSDLN